MDAGRGFLAVVDILGGTKTELTVPRFEELAGRKCTGIVWAESRAELLAH